MLQQFIVSGVVIGSGLFVLGLIGIAVFLVYSVLR